MTKVWDGGDFLFGDGPATKAMDTPHYGLDMLMSRLRRRNPPLPPWLRRYARSWQRFEPGLAPETREPLVYGLCQAWNEDDIIYATARNLYNQGVDRVFVIDDASDDDTVPEARMAGATVVQDGSDGTFDELRRSQRIMQVIEERTAAEGRPVWWVVVDADEFPRGPGGKTIRELLGALPPGVDTVGSRVLEHYPGTGSEPKPRHHPLDEVPHARWHDLAYCPAGHWKHQVLLVREPGELRFTFGRHTIAARPERKPVVESESALLMHHFPLRNRERTERRFRSAASSTGRYGASSDTFVQRRTENRLRTLALAYAQRYDLIPNMVPGEPKRGITVRDWRDLVTGAERSPGHQVGAPL